MLGEWTFSFSAARVQGSKKVSALVDRTVYANEAATPKLNLRQIFGRQGLDTGLCRLSADKGLLTVEMFAMLGQDLSSAKETLRKLWEADMSPLGADAASQELSVMSLAAVWQAAQALQTQYASRRARMEEDPNKIPELSQEDHAEFRDRFVRVHPESGRDPDRCQGAAQEVRGAIVVRLPHPRHSSFLRAGRDQDAGGRNCREVRALEERGGPPLHLEGGSARTSD